MLRFRTVEDEKRYLALVTEVYLRLGTSGISPKVVSEILRNIAKIETFAFYEGIRQGVAAGVLKLVQGEPTALDLHRALYGSVDTPLSAKEKEHVLTDLDLHKVFENTPAEFAPLTLQEAIQTYGPTLEPAIGSDRGKIEIAKDFDAPLRLEEDHDSLFENLDIDLKQFIESTEISNDSIESPEFLDRIRDELKTMLDSGWQPKDYPDVIVALQRVMQTDAVILDLQLGSKQGRTILEQVGLFGLPLIPMDGSEVDIRFVEHP